jgi:type IV pilus assembly protein PilA
MRTQTERGFTLIELMIVVVVIGILAAIAIPNYISMEDRAKEGSTKANMHSFQLAAEDYGVDNDGTYANLASDVAANLPSGGSKFENPFSGLITNSWEDRAAFSGAPSATAGIVSYADSSGTTYNIKGVGKAVSGPMFPMSLVLTAGE